MTHVVEPLDSKPFEEWVRRQVEAITKDPSNWQSAPAGDAMPRDGYVILGDRIGVGDSWLRKGAWKRKGAIERATVEEALHLAGIRIEDLYPHLAEVDDSSARTAWCSTCQENVITDGDGSCPWCDKKLLNKDGSIHLSAGQMVGAQKMSINTVELAWKMHIESGVSIHQISKILIAETRYASAKSLANALLRTMHAAKLPVTSRSDAVIRANVARAFQPDCPWILRSGPLKGRPCGRPARGAGPYCQNHQESHVRAGLERLKAWKAQQDADAQEKPRTPAQMAS